VTFESAADRLALLQAVGGEPFDTGHPFFLTGIFDEAYLETEVSDYSVANREPVLLCRSTDVVVHELVKHSKVTRVSDHVSYLVKDFEADGTGITLIRLRK
jgi:hypothetical protein